MSFLPNLVQIATKIGPQSQRMLILVAARPWALAFRASGPGGGFLKRFRTDKSAMQRNCIHERMPAMQHPH